MTYKIKLFFVAIILGFSLNMKAQKTAIIKFEKSEIDFGKIHEDSGKVECVFNFTNVGDDTLKIETVRASCGCTTPFFTKELVPPKCNGEIKVTYNPLNRPGDFKKSVKILANTMPSETEIFISGSVTAHIKTIKDVFPISSGNLRLKNNEWIINNISNKQTKTDSIKIYNAWNKLLSIKTKNVPKHITCKVVPENLEPQKEGMIYLTYDAKAKNDFEVVFDKITLATNDSIDSVKTISISANIYEDFSSMTVEQRENAAKAKFLQEAYEMGILAENSRQKFSLDIKNDGKSDLIIHKIRSSCECVKMELVKDTIKPGEMTMLNVDFNAAGRSGKQYKIITVICNDPMRPKVQLKLFGEVEDCNPKPIKKASETLKVSNTKKTTTSKKSRRSSQSRQKKKRTK